MDYHDKSAWQPTRVGSGRYQPDDAFTVSSVMSNHDKADGIQLELGLVVINQTMPSPFHQL
ncbi:hypothetical protein ACK318_17905 [Aeromonas dhakensis]